MNWHDATPAAYRNAIVTGDARKLARKLPPESVDVIFADPVYQNVADYRWLAKTALRVLRPKGMVLAWCSKPKFAYCQIAMEKAGLEYVYDLDYTVVAKTYRMRWYNLFCWTTPLLWMQRPGSASRPRRWIPDTFSSQARTSGAHPWNKNIEVLLSWLDAFCPLDGVVFDPFTGSGSVPVAATMLCRDFIAFEIDPATADMARTRLAATTPPLPGLVIEQPLLLEEEAA